MAIGKLYIVSAPSGAGKTSLVKQAASSIDQLKVSISHTTRDIREGETDGKDYFFTPVTDFKQMIHNHAFLEYAQVFNNYYGTTQQSVEQMLNQGNDVILEIDWQGAEQVKKMLPDSVSIFILPPSIEVLQHRLEKRGQDNEDIISVRMQGAVNEMSHCHKFDYIIINDDFNLALTELSSIIISHRLKSKRQLQKFSALIELLL